MFGWIAETTLIAAGLAVVAGVVGRSSRVSAEARHLLWVVVLIKFLLPPVVAWPTLDFRTKPLVVAAHKLAPLNPAATPAAEVIRPSVAPTPVPLAEVEPFPVALAPTPPTESIRVEHLDPIVSSEPVPAEPEPELGSRHGPPLRRVLESRVEVAGLGTAPPPTKLGAGDVPWFSILLATWVVGSMVVAGRGLIRVGRFRRVLAQGEPAPGWLGTEVVAVADQFGVRTPRVLVVPGVTSPLLWCLGRPCLVVPPGWDQLTIAARSALIAHELAHLSRWDHWVVRLELLAGLVWWWNPVWRLARRRVRDEAELACDARVVRAFPDGRFTYAESLIAVCETAARAVPPLPALGIGGPRAARTLEARLTMILRDPVRPPTRWTPLLALTLLVLAAPSWTRGQPPQDSPRPAEAPQAEAARPAEPIASAAADPEPQPVVAPAATWTLTQIRDGMITRPWPSHALACRYVASRRLKDLAENSTRVEVEVAAVTLGRGIVPDGTNELWPQPNDRLGELVRLDILGAAPAADGSFPPSPQPGQVQKLRRFTARTRMEDLSFTASLDRVDPVPIEWVKITNEATDETDDLADRLLNRPVSFGPGDMILPPGMPNLNQGPVATQRLRPTPSGLLDLAGTARLLFLSAVTSQMEVAGTEPVDGVDTVRVAWTAKPDNTPEIRGLAWVAPTLGFAVVRLEAAQSGRSTGQRQTWSRTSTHFERVGDVWLPRQVTWKTAVAPTEPNATGIVIHATEAEVAATFEDFRVNPPVNAATFHPQFSIEALTPQTGHFTAKPLALPPDLADRLNRAIAASPFGPPRIEEPNRAAIDPATPSAAVPAPTAPVAVPPDPTRIAAAGPPAAVAASAPISPPVSLLKAQRATQATEVARAEAIRDRANLELGNTLKLFNQKGPAVSSNEVNLYRANLKIAEAGVAREQAKLAEIDAQLNPFDSVPARPNLAVLQARRAAQAAEVARVEAVRDRVKLEFESTDKLGKAMTVSRNEVELVRANLKAAEATVAREQAKLAEADAQLKPDNGPPSSQANLADLQARRTAQAVVVQQAADQLAEAETASVGANNAFQGGQLTQAELDQSSTRQRIADLALKLEKVKLAELDALLAQLGKVNRAASNLLQPRRAAQAAEVEKFAAQLTRARADHDRAENLMRRNAIGRQEYDQINASFAIATAELAREQAKLAEIDANASAPLTKLAPVAANPAVLSARRDAQAAEVQRFAAQATKASADRNRAEALKQRNGIGAAEYDQIQANFSIANAELAREQAKLAEADALLAQARPQAEATSDAQEVIELAEMQVQVKQVELSRAESEADRAQKIFEARAPLFKEARITQREWVQTQNDLSKAQDEVKARQVAVREAELHLKQARRRAVGTQPLSTESRSIAATHADALGLGVNAQRSLADWRDQIAWAELQWEGKKQQRDQAQRRVEVATSQLNRVKKEIERGTVGKERAEQANAALQAAQDEMDTAHFAVQEAELRLKQARGRFEAEKVRVQREAGRARDRLDWSTKMFTNGFVSRSSYAEDRARYDDLMAQLDPDHKPTPEATVTTPPPPPAPEPAKAPQ